jgi:hypothetical protein
VKTPIAACIAAAAWALGATGCATIVAKSSQPITVTSVPPGAAVSITNRAGSAVHSGNTPMTVTLKKGAGYFKPERYVVRVSKEGFQSRELRIDGAVNGWYFGNIVFGGLIGMVAVDPATGAMYTLRPDAVDATLDAVKVAREPGEQSLTVVLVADVPPDMRNQLVEITAD